MGGNEAEGVLMLQLGIKAFPSSPFMMVCGVYSWLWTCRMYLGCKYLLYSGPSVMMKARDGS